MARKTVSRETYDECSNQLGAYQEAFWALRRGETPIKVTVSGSECEISAEVLGITRACGGVVVDGSHVSYMTDWLLRASKLDAYHRELARKVEHEIEKANVHCACDRCHGTGAASGSMTFGRGMVDCSKCGGTGSLTGAAAADVLRNGSEGCR